MKKISFVIILLVFSSTNIFSQETEKNLYKTTRTAIVPVINGMPDNDVWNLGEWSGDFTQFKPYDGKVATQPTEFKYYI